MRTKDEILKELGRNRQPGAYGGIPTDTRDFILTEVLIDIRDILDNYQRDQARRYGETFPEP